MKQPGGKLARSKPATVKRGEECKPFYTPDLRTVPGVAVRHSEVTPKPHDEQAIAGGVAQFNESSIVIHCNWLHDMLDVAWQTLLTTLAQPVTLILDKQLQEITDNFQHTKY